jgi:hypothetical protein
VADRHELAELLVDTVRQLAAARGECESYRLVARAAIHHAHDQHVDLLRLREQHEHVKAEYRAYRAATICPPTHPVGAVTRTARRSMPIRRGANAPTAQAEAANVSL